MSHTPSDTTGRNIEQQSSAIISEFSPSLDGDEFSITIGSLLCSTHSLHVEAFLGEGTFGKVAKCVKISTNEAVAVKITKKNPVLMEQAEEEINALRQLESLDAGNCNIVQWYGSFVHKGHICLQFELLDISLHEFMEKRSFQPLSMSEIRPVVHQLATALRHLEAVGIVHADLKLENIMMVDHIQQPLRIKIIDFGLAHLVTETRLGSCLQTLWYRSPEILLGLPFSEAIDMWSVGCVVAELYLGCAIYPANSEYDMMRYIVETQGQPVDCLLISGLYTTTYFNLEIDCAELVWKLKTPAQYQTESGNKSSETRSCRLGSLDELEEVNSITEEISERKHCVDLLKQMMNLDAKQRATPDQVLQHPFLSMDQIHQSSHVNFTSETLSQQLKTRKRLYVDGPHGTRSLDSWSPDRKRRSFRFELEDSHSPCRTASPAEEAAVVLQADISASLEDEDKKEADTQPEVIEKKKKTKGRVRRFFRRIFKALCCCISCEED